MPQNRPTAPQLEDLAKQDKEHLVRLQNKLQVLRDRVVSVAMGYHSGCIVTGRGGTSKSYTIVQELNRIGAAFKLTNSHITPRALFDLLKAYPDSVHLIEDAEAVTRNGTSVGLLRSAMWGSREDREGRMERVITWETHRASTEVVFAGGVILVTNRRLSDLPEVQALATRVPYMELNVSDREIAALMRKAALDGFQRGGLTLEARECVEVAEFIIAESARLGRALDMRLLINAFADRLQAEDCYAGCSWQDLVYSTLAGRPSVLHEVEPVGIREQNKARELELAREIVSLNPAERLKIWREKTGKSQASLYRRLSELGKADSLDFDL